MTTTTVCWAAMLTGLMGVQVLQAADEKAVFQLAPGVAVEAEDFAVERGWRAIHMGEGNYAVDIIGFIHTSGERFLHVAAEDATASAHREIVVPQAGAYRLWVRYEYMPFSEARFRVAVEQAGKVVAEKIMGGSESLRTTPWSDGTKLVQQYDPPWGNEGLTEEPLDVPGLAAGPATLRLQAVEQPRIEGRTANRNIDCLYLTADVEDQWRRQPRYKQWYGILPAMMDTIGPRYEVQFTNRGDKPATFAVRHVYNRVPWSGRESDWAVKDLPPGATSAWMPLKQQDLAHFSLSWFSVAPAQPFEVAVWPVGGEVEARGSSSGEPVGVFLPPYPHKGDKALNVLDVQDAVIAAVKAAPAPGREPTLPLAYGCCIPYQQDNAYGRKYAELFKTIGMRNTGQSSGTSREDHYRNLKAVGLGPTRSGAYMKYRLPPTAENIAKAKAELEKTGAIEDLLWFDYGDEIGFGEWFNYMVAEQKKTSGDAKLTVEAMILPLWRQWLQDHRPGYEAADYWRQAWGELDPAQLRPDASAEAAAEKPKLYVDSVLFYEDVSIDYVARGAAAVRAALGEHVHTGCNYSCYPFYYPHTAMYVKWFRRGAADKGQHSEYFWQLGQVTPMVNGYVAELFRAGMRFNPKAVLKQYQMPHSPGNTDASFRRSSFTHLAHGARMLDYFGIGLPETFTENHINFRDPARYVAIRDVNYALGMVEDVWLDATPAPASVALLVSESTERWDGAKVASDHLTKGQPARNFRDHRLTYHQERVGIYTALCFAGAAPDLVVEEDLANAELLRGYKVLYVVGDCLPVELTAALEAWVSRGGVLMASAGAGQFGMYREPNPGLAKLLGIQLRTLEEKDQFMRTSQELPFLKPVGMVKTAAGQYPALAIAERATPAGDATILATFADDGKPAAWQRSVGTGQVIYTASLPGVAYLWTGLTTPRIEVPDRGPGVHRTITTYDTHAARWLLSALDAAGVQPTITIPGGYLDARLLKARDGFLLPLANYRDPVDHSVTITITPPADAGQPAKAISSSHGPVSIAAEQGRWNLTLPRLGFGDMVRITTR